MERIFVRLKISMIALDFSSALLGYSGWQIVQSH